MRKIAYRPFVLLAVALLCMMSFPEKATQSLRSVVVAGVRRTCCRIQGFGGGHVPLCRHQVTVQRSKISDHTSPKLTVLAGNHPSLPARFRDAIDRVVSRVPPIQRV